MGGPWIALDFKESEWREVEEKGYCQEAWFDLGSMESRWLPKEKNRKEYLLLRSQYFWLEYVDKAHDEGWLDFLIETWDRRDE